MKVVINRRWGGFGLSSKALLLLYERGSKVVKASEPKDYYGNRPDWEKTFERDRVRYASLDLITLAPDGKIITKTYDDYSRADPELVRVVEELGHEADGHYASLEIVEIPDGIEWTIHDYDGMETVQEKHREWS